MKIVRAEKNYSVLPKAVLDGFEEVGSALAADCVVSRQVIDGGIKATSSGARLVGQAMTATARAGDSRVVQIALKHAGPGAVLVIDAGGGSQNAMWGDVATKSAKTKGVLGLVVDGAVRDVAAMRKAEFPCFSRHVIPRGPLKGAGGEIGRTCIVGGVTVSPGDLIIGDDDGVTVIPMEEASDVLKACQAKLVKEGDWMAKIDDGQDVADVLGVTEDETVSE